MWIRIIRDGKHGEEEMLINTGHISKIEVQYQNGGWRAFAENAANNPECQRVYVLHVAGDKFTLASNVNSKVLAVIEGIYKSAVTDA